MLVRSLVLIDAASLIRQRSYAYRTRSPEVESQKEMALGLLAGGHRGLQPQRGALSTGHQVSSARCAEYEVVRNEYEPLPFALDAGYHCLACMDPQAD